MKIARLRTRLLLRLLAVILGIGLVFGLSLNHYLRVLLETEVEDKASLVLSHVLALQTYVRETLRPTMYDILPQDGFVMEAMSTSYVTRKVMSDFNAAKEKFTYRRVALDPRNPEYGADAMERELIAHFQANPTETQVERWFTSGGQEYFLMARPVTFDETCLSCHGKPSDAPKVLLARYGSERGFGRQSGEIAGLDGIIMPVEQEAAAISRAMVNFVVFFACGTVIIMLISHVFFDRATAMNIGRLAALMRERFPAEAGRTLDNPSRRPPDGGGEIEGMIEDMERFADHLRDARRELADYAANLEAKVEERTTEATREAQARSADVRLFLTVLELFVKGADRLALLDRALAAVAGRFGAQAAGFSCFYSMNQRCWPATQAVAPLSEADREALFEGRGVFAPGLAMVGVHAAGTVRGALTLTFDGPVELSGQEREVLAAVGHQLGIALENLEAMENLLRQKTVLESIFEGIADPLFLLSGAGEVLHANESAAQLLTALGPDAHLLGLPGLAAETAQAAGAAGVAGAAMSREVSLPGSRSLTLRAYPLEALAGSGGMGRAIVYARDNTMEKTMMARLQQSEKSMALGLLSAGLAHEINNPLGVILCYARLLWDDGQSPHAADLDIIIRYTLQAQKVLEDLMRFARPKPESVGPVDLAPAVEFIARVFKGKAVKTGIEIVTHVPENLPPVRANASALEQILTNLLLNALDALEEQAASGGGRVSIEARHDRSANEALLIVRDDGPGIPPEDLSRLFDPFFTTKSVGKGTGLGLSVVYGLVSGLGGHIEAANDSGAVFTVHLPIWAEGHGDSDD
jgi:signal transduction histidine kinase